MTWTDGVDRATGYLVTAANWNDLIGASGSLMELKLHTHDGTAGDGASSLGPLVLEDFTTAAAPAAPGAGKGRLYSVTGDVPGWRGGAAGAAKVIAYDPTSAQGDVLYRDSAGALARLAPGTSGHFLKTQGAGADPVWAAAVAVHVEAKASADAASPSVTWTTTFSTTPVAVCSSLEANTGLTSICQVTSRSTTGATLEQHDAAGDPIANVAMVIAQEAT